MASKQRLLPTGPYVDTDIIIRLITNDDPIKQKAAAKLFEQVENGGLILTAPDTVVADAVFVLSSRRLYHLPRPEIRDVLISLLRYPNFKIGNKRAIIQALELYSHTNLDFGDCLIAALASQTQTREIYSYDHDFDKIKLIMRIEPGS